MRIGTMAIAAGLMVIPAQARDNYSSVMPQITVCMQGASDFRVTGQAQVKATAIFDAASVRVNWRAGFKGCPAEGILVTVMDRTPPELHPGALAYAAPYEGAHIWVLHDRIAQSGPELLPVLLAHVLVHEIGHILQGSVRHSEQGLMKAHWSRRDLNSMLRNPLDFTAEDVELIHRGVEGRGFRLAAVSRLEMQVAAVR